MIGLYSFAIAWVIGKIIDMTIGFRISADDEAAGIDVTAHAETAYDLAPAGGGASRGAVTGTAAPRAVSPDKKVEAEA